MASKNKKVDIKKKPTLAVSGLKKPSRKASSSNVVFSASWSYPKKAFDETREDRFQGVIVKWTLDEDPASTKAKNQNEKYKAEKKDEKTGKTTTITKKVMTGSLTGIKQAEVFYSRKKGSSKTEASKTLKRSKFYPAPGKKVLTAKVYRVVKATYSSTGKRWRIKKSKLYSNMVVSKLNSLEKKGQVLSVLELTKLPKGTKMAGKLYYISKVDPRYSGTKTIAAPKLYGVGATVQGWNLKSSSNNKKATNEKNVVWDEKVPSQAVYVPFSVPDPPTITRSVAGENASHVITFSVDATADDGTSTKERYDSVYTLSVATGFYNAKGKWVSSKMTAIPGMKGKTETKKTFNITRNPGTDMPTGRAFLSLARNEYITYHLSIYNRGFAGDGKETEANKNSGQTWFTYAWPDTPVIKSVVENGARCVIKFANASERNVRYTTKYTLQRLANYRPAGTGSDTPVDDWDDKKWIEAATADQGWVDVYSVSPGELQRDNAKNYPKNSDVPKIGHFTDAAYAHTVDPFKRTYYRIKASNDIYGIPDMFSAPVVVPGFWKIPSAANEESKFLSLTPTEDGQALKAIVSFKKTRTAQGDQLNSNGTEVSWDTADYAWSSTTPPSSYDFKDETVKPILVTQQRKDKWDSLRQATLNWFYATYYVRGITSNESYYVKARRFLKDTETRETDSYGPYASYSVSNAVATIKVTTPPKDVKLFVPERLVYGKDLSVSWTYDSDDVQTSYELMWLQGTSSAAINNAKRLAGATDSAPYCVVKWSSVAGKVFCTKSGSTTQKNVYLAVRVTTDGGTSKLSEVKTVPVYTPPSASISCAATISAQPVKFTIGTNDPAASAVIRVVSDQVIDWAPFGSDNQADGSIIYTNKVTPSWTKKTQNNKTWYYTNYTLPICDFRNGGRYTIEYTTVVDDTGLDSNTVDENGNVVRKQASFAVNYTESIDVPPFYVVVDPLRDDHGSSARISICSISAPKNCVADVYRVTPDGVHLLVGGVENWRNATITDPYPPYSRHEPCTYRLALRSENGVREWSDRSYALPGYSVRFDWGEKESEAEGVYTHLTLPYNLKWSDSWTKNSRVDLHLDGTYAGYWRKGVDHKNTLSTELVKLTGAEQIARVIALAKHTGPVLVRLPNGRAFAADVQVSNLDVSYELLVVSASFSAQEIRMPEKFSNAAVTVSDGLYVPQQ